MSDAATRDRVIKQDWAHPGSRHDRLVRVAKLALPVAALGLLGLLAISPFDHRSEVSFILDKNKVDSAHERMRIDSARYTGVDNQGRRFAIGADKAVQPSSEQPIVSIEGMTARLDLADGPLGIVANRGRYDIDQQKVRIDGPVRVAGANGYRIETSDVSVDLKTRQLVSAGAVRGSMKLGSFTAGHLAADLGDRRVALTGGARLKIVQGAVR